jgi:hypothetical protein
VRVLLEHPQIRLNVIQMTSAYDTPFGDVVENLLPFGSVLKGESQRNTFFIFWQRIGVAGRSSVISNLKLTTSAGVCFNATKVEVIQISNTREIGSGAHGPEASKWFDMLQLKMAFGPWWATLVEFHRRRP